MARTIPVFRIVRSLLGEQKSVAAACAFLLLAGCSAQQPPPVPVPTQPPPQPAHVEQPPVPPGMDPGEPGQADAPQPATQFPKASEHSNTALTYRIIDAPNGTFGYDILSDGRLFVHQSNLPGMPGNEGCKTKANAEKLAAFVIEKMKKGEMPPSVTPEELKALNIH